MKYKHSLKFFPVVGRCLISLIFIMSGFVHFTQLNDLTLYATSRGIPMASVAVLVGGAMLLVGGFMLLLGIHTRIASLILMAFLVPVTFTMHNPIGLTGVSQQIEIINLFKNLGFMGILLEIMYHGSGPISYDWYFRSEDESQMLMDEINDTNKHFVDAFLNEAKRELEQAEKIEKIK